MSRKERLQDLHRWAKHLGLTVYTWSPGDGTTRYKFNFDADTCYYGCRSLYTALGLKEAFTWLNGYWTAVAYRGDE